MIQLINEDVEMVVGAGNCCSSSLDGICGCTSDGRNYIQEKRDVTLSQCKDWCCNTIRSPRFDWVAFGAAVSASDTSRAC